MIRRALQLCFYDVLFQFRHGFYLIYLIVSLLYIIILLSTPDAQRLLVTNALVFSDTSVLGLTFVGAIVLLEKQQSILHSLFVTPIQLGEYLLAKVISLTLLAILATMLIFVIPNGFAPLSGFYILGVMGGASVFTLIGLGVGARVNSLNGYIFGIMAGTIIFTVPLLAYFGVYDSFWLYALPTRATLMLLSSAHRSLSLGHVVYAMLNLLIWNSLAAIFAAKSFQKYILKG